MEQGAAACCKTVREEIVWEGKWVKMKHVIWQDPAGKEHVWEALERANHRKAPVDAVEIVAILKKSDHKNQLVLVRQFRPPPGAYTLELPAGLCDADEAPETTATRELQEETGYTAKVADVGLSIMFGTALSKTTSAIVTVVIDGDEEQNKNPQPHTEADEFIEVLYAPVEGLLGFLEERQKLGDIIDGKIWMIAHTLKQVELFLH